MSPVWVQAVEQWPQISLIDGLVWLKQGVIFTCAMTAVAEASGKRRRYFYLVAGILAWGGAVLSILFLATTGITANAFSALTGMVYSGADHAGLSYLIIGQRDLLGVVTATCPFVLLFRQWRNLDWPSSRAIVGLAVSVCVLLTGVRWWWHDYGPGRVAGSNQLGTIGTLLDPAAPVAAYVSISRALPLARDMLLQSDRAPPLIRTSPQPTPLTVIVVVGESTTRNHMGLYGYCRNTTPILSGRVADLFVFHNTISEIPMTVFALSNGLRVALDGAHGHPDQSIFDVFNAAGFHTYWLSNQFDYPGDPVSALTRRAAHQVVTYSGKKNSAEYTATLDGALLAPLQAVISDDPASKVIFLHTVGTHSNYHERVPANFLSDAFRDNALNRTALQRDVIDAYDKAVRYADLILSQVIDLAGRADDVAVIYFSDHGDEVFDSIDFVGHRFPRTTPSMVEIPLLVWLSPQLRARQPALVAALDAAVPRKMDIRDVAPLVLDIAGIEVDGLPERRRPLSGHFLPQKRSVGGEDYDRDPTLGIARQLPALACHQQ